MCLSSKKNLLKSAASRIPTMKTEPRKKSIAHSLRSVTGCSIVLEEVFPRIRRLLLKREIIKKVFHL